MKIRLLVASLFFCAAHYIHSMENNFFSLIGMDNGHIVSCSIENDVAQSIPYIRDYLADEDKKNGSMNFPGATHYDLTRIAQYVKMRSIMEKYPNDTKIASNLYWSIKMLDVPQLIRFTNNVCKLYPKEQVPVGLLNPLVEKIRSQKNDIVIEVKALPYLVQMHMHKKIEEKEQKSYENKALLKKCDICNESIITRLIAPYSKQLNQLDYLFPCYKSVCSLLYTPVVEYIYLGKTIIASIEGTVILPYSLYRDYTLNIQTQCGVKTFELNRNTTIEFCVDGAFANKDESLFVCHYRGLCNDNADKGGIFIVNLNNDITKQIECSYKACCFGSKNEIYVFDNDGYIYSLDSNSGFYKSDYTGENMKGVINDDINSRFIMWNHGMVYAQEKRFKSVPKELCHFDDASIANVIMDSQGKRLCIKVLSQGGFEYFVYDCVDGFLKSIKKIGGKSFASFSSDDNLLTIGYYKDNVTTYDIFDTFSLSSWSKQTAGKLMALGNDRSLEILEDFSAYYPRVVTLFDEDIRKGLNVITDETHSIFEVDPVVITTALYNDEANNDNYPEPILKMFAAVDKQSVIESAQQQSLRNNIGKIGQMIKNSKFVMGVIVVTVIAGVYNLA